MTREKTEVFIMKIPSSIKSELHARSEAEGKSMAQIVLKALNHYLGAEADHQTVLILEALKKLEKRLK